MHHLDMNVPFGRAVTKARIAALGPVKKSELRFYTDLWHEWDTTYCMGGEL